MNFLKTCLNKLRFVSLVFLASFVLTACSSEPTLDTSSVEAYEASIEEMSKNLTPKQKRELEKALVFYALFQSDIVKKEEPQGKNYPYTSNVEQLDGYTYAELIENYQKDKKSKKNKKRK